MTAPLPRHGGFSESELRHVLERACETAGLDSTGAVLLRGHTNAVVRLAHAPVVVKIARRGSHPTGVERTIRFVRWLMERDFPTVPLYPGPDQPTVIDGHPVTFWTYLPQPDKPVTAGRIAGPLRALHRLPAPPFRLRPLDNVSAIRASLAAITSLPQESVRFLSRRVDRLEKQLTDLTYELPEAVLQGDPQHRNALYDGKHTVLCDWDTVAWGQPEWDLTTIEIHCRRFGHGAEHYERFARAYGYDVTGWSGYPVLRDIRELRMVTTNARKAAHTPGSLAEVERRIVGLRESDSQLRWNIL
ncbi:MULTISPECIES: aminoglycoside phosphotransferase family protein [Streptomyces]|uniref:aminoglycoside phosphotransferase family protein n=1 Tax=Streptomyces TaxID=1883 RepID=UPI000C6D70BB|nr:aminoglycoside phosphotransferase family protein [Streptomyces barkulensis]